MTVRLSKAAFAPSPFLAPFRLQSSTSSRSRTLSRSSRSSWTIAKPYMATSSPTPSTKSSPSVSTSSSVRVRFAPSPTGALHVGGARTALYNWLLARQSGGSFLLRVEDTDQARSTRESEEAVLSDLRWLGLIWDEGPQVGGPHGPYRQSERSQVYQELAQRLVKEGKAYPCFCTEQELEAQREKAEAEGKPPQYDGTWRNADPNEVERRIKAGEEYTIRFLVPDNEVVLIDDHVRGKVRWDANATVGDFILLRSNGVPVYNFCVAVDDALMGVSTVIRAEEHLTNTLRQVLILRALGFAPPRYAHCSLILGKDRSKLSKRHGATSVTQFKEEGYLPVAMLNYLATLGWNDGTEQEIYTVDELINKFDITRITKSPAMFDGDKLRFINGQHLRALPAEKLEQLVVDEWKRTGVFKEQLEPGSVLSSAAVALVRGSLELVNDANEQMKDVFMYPLEDTIQSGEANELIAEEGGFLELSKLIIEAYDNDELPFGKDGDEHTSKWKKWVKATGKATGRKGKRLFHPLRLALTGKMSGPDVGEILKVLNLIEESDAADAAVYVKSRIDSLRKVVESM